MKEHFLGHIAELEAASRVNRLARSVDGWFTELEGAALYQAAKNGSGKGKIVEIGSFKGKSTIWLASGSKEAGREQVYAVDTHRGSPEHQPGGEFSSHMPPEGTTELVFRQNIREAGVADWVEPIVRSSQEALALWTDPIRLLFIDGNHSYEEVRSDFLGWERFVVPDGLIAFHDVDRWDSSPRELDGPTRVVYEDVTRTASYAKPIIVNHLAFVLKER